MPPNNPYNNPNIPPNPGGFPGSPNNGPGNGLGNSPGQFNGQNNNLGQPPFNPYTADQYQRPMPQQLPQQPSVPFFLDPNGPYAHIGAPPPKRNKHKSKKAMVIAAVALVVAGGIIFAMQGKGTDPDELFYTAIANSLATHSYSQKEVSGQDNVQLKQDVTDIKKPRQSGTVDLVSQGARLEGYSSIDNSYIRYTQFPPSSSTSTATILNKWQQIRKKGTLPDGYTQTSNLVDAFEARTSIMGSFIIGNFSEADQQTIGGLIQSKAVYSYEPTAVAPEEVDGEPVMRYDVKVNPTALKELNQKVGALMGLTQTDVDATIKAIDPDAISKTVIKMYISTNSQRLIKASVTQGDQTTATTYTAFNSSVVSTEPTADFQYDEFQALLTGQAGSSLTGRALDTERKTDVDSLATFIKTYRVQSGFYPTLAEMNDANWIAANLKNLPDTTLLDPLGTTKQFAALPTANQYSYQPYKDSSLASCDAGSCGYFKVSATLSDNTVYTKTSASE